MSVIETQTIVNSQEKKLVAEIISNPNGTNMMLDDEITKVRARGVDVFYGAKQALFDVNIDIPKKSVTAFIGPSGCGKSTFLRCINRMNDTIDTCRVSGSILIDQNDVNSKSVDPVMLRASVGMVCLLYTSRCV